MGLQNRHRVRADLAARHARQLANLVHEEIDEFGNVVAPLGERGHADRHDRQTMKEILAEGPLLDRRGEVAARRGDDAHIDMHAGRAAHALEILVDKDAQDLALRFLRHVGDFVEIERAAVGFLQRANLALASVGGLHAEQFHLHGFGRDGRRVQHDEWPRRARGGVMNRARREFLAGARGAGDEDARIGRARAVDDLPQLVDEAR